MRSFGKVTVNPQGTVIIEDAKRPLRQGGEHHSLPGLQVPESFLVLLLRIPEALRESEGLCLLLPGSSGMLAILASCLQK